MPAETLIHAHDVLDILSAEPAGLSIAALQERCAAAFGADAVYTNCMGIRFQFDALLPFLLGRGKIALSDGLLHRIAEGCDHGHDHGHQHHGGCQH